MIFTEILNLYIIRLAVSSARRARRSLGAERDVTRDVRSARARTALAWTVVTEYEQSQ